MSESYGEFYTNRKPGQFIHKFLKTWNRRMLAIAATAIPALNDKTILEIGPGHGFFASVCHEKQIEYCGHEMNTGQTSHLRSLGYEITQATIPPIPSGSPVQVIWLSHVLEHAKDYQEARQMLIACHDRLDAEGYVVIIAPDVHHWKSDFWSVDWSHGFPTTLNRVEQLLNDTGFTIRKAVHQTCTVTNPFFAWFISLAFYYLIPCNLLDYIFKKLGGRDFASSFMHVFGLRQIYLIGQK